MNYFFRALRAETLKTKRTLALWLTLIAPLAVAFLVLIIFVDQGIHTVPSDRSIWISISENALILWTLLMLPLFVTLETGLLSSLEHGPKNWKLLYTLPVPRWAIYAAKQVVSVTVIGLSMLVLVAYIFVIGKILMFLNPGMGLEAPMPILTILKYTALTFLSSWLIIAIHQWVSSHWSSFVVAMGFGIIATIASALVIESDKYAPYYPWTLPSFVENGLVTGVVNMQSMWIGLIGGLIIFLIGCWEVTRRDVL